MDYVYEVWEATFMHGHPTISLLFTYGNSVNADKMVAFITGRDAARTVFIRPVLLADVAPNKGHR